MKILVISLRLLSFIVSLANVKMLFKLILAIKTLSADRFSEILQVLLGQTKTKILT